MARDNFLTLDGLCGAAPVPTYPLNRLEPNPSMEGIGGCWLVQGLQPMTIPEAAALCRQLVVLMPGAAVASDALVEVVMIRDEREVYSRACSPSGRVRRFPGHGVILDVDRHQKYCRLYCIEGVAPAARRLIGEPRLLDVAIRAEVPIGPLLQSSAPCFVGGLISLSAEPPEGFFAASTSVELQENGWPAVSASDAEVWLYRVPDSRPHSYFEFMHPSPLRPADDRRCGKFLIATGIGPASDPTSPGGREADLLWLGDEQHGPLLDYLRTLSRPDLNLSHLTAHRGLLQRLPDGRVLLCQADKAWALTREGFNGLHTDPLVYRQVYSAEYDAYLRTLFQPPAGPAAEASYLLATSRGCTQGCALCCSGGLKAFQSFSATRMLDELHKLAALHPGKPLDLFLLDSNFNNHPERLIEFARLYTESPLYGQFRFFVRHNTVAGFLKGNVRKQPNLALIEAFRLLGIREVFMGVDTFDDHSTLTLKSNRLHMVKKGSSTRPTYTTDELADLIAALEASGAETRAFYLQNNPWVTDLDRVDSYYNIAELWLQYPHFSIDARYRDVNRLKPFAGSPIELVSRSTRELVRDGRYVATGVLGELDEWIDITVFGVPRHRGEVSLVLETFRNDLERVRVAAEAGQKRGCRASELILAKMKQRDARLKPLVTSDQQFVDTICRFAARWEMLPGVEPETQRELFEQAAAGLFEGLVHSLPRRRPAAARAVAVHVPRPIYPGLRTLGAIGYRAAVQSRSVPLDGGLPGMPLRRSS